MDRVNPSSGGAFFQLAIFSLLFSGQNAYAQNNNIHPVKLRLRGELWSLWCGLIDIAAILLAETELLSNNVC